MQAVTGRRRVARSAATTIGSLPVALLQPLARSGFR
jgi:hypothetical protein